MKDDLYYYNKGQEDCRTNKIPANGMPDPYYEGYSDQYAKEQKLLNGEMA